MEKRKTNFREKRRIKAKETEEEIHFFFRFEVK